MFRKSLILRFSVPVPEVRAVRGGRSTPQERLYPELLACGSASIWGGTSSDEDPYQVPRAPKRSELTYGLS